jgi:DNA polymerase
MPIPPDVRAKLASYLQFQRDLGGIEGVRFAADQLLRAGTPPVEGTSVGTMETLDEIRAEIGENCQRCKLSQGGRHRIVFGDGNPHAELVFVGEAPGADEDVQGLPFVGRGGQLLTDMIQKGMGLRREDVYICNVAKCRPPGNRTPEKDEIEACSPFLVRQLLAVAPRLVIALGSTAAQALHPYKGSLTSVRGVVHPLHLEFGGRVFDTQLVVTYHPAYLLRDPSQKREAWKDLQLAMRFLGIQEP